jgi:hypothetical protein
MDKIAPYYKAVSGALIALLTGLVGGLANDGLSTSEVLVSLIAMLTVGGTVFSVPNFASNYPSKTEAVPTQLPAQAPTASESEVPARTNIPDSPPPAPTSRRKKK